MSTNSDSSRPPQPPGGFGGHSADAAGNAESSGLRLVAPPGDAAPPATRPQPIRRASDPRWVFASEVAASLQGSVVPPEERGHLMRLAGTLGMSPFQANVVIAIVQDQTRRGFTLESFPEGTAALLAMVPQPRPPQPQTQPPSADTIEWPRKPGTVLPVLAAATAMFGAQLLLLWQVLG